MNLYRARFLDGNTARESTVAAESPEKATTLLRATYPQASCISVVMLQERVFVSKEQERQALRKVGNILLSLGEDSYLATAFAGAIPDAERNIDEDAAYSMKNRWESAERYLKETAKTLENRNKELENALRQNKSALSLTREESLLLCSLLQKELNELRETAANATKEIVRFAEAPHRSDFVDATHRHRQAVKALEAVEKLTKKISDYAPNGQ